MNLEKKIQLPKHIQTIYRFCAVLFIDILLQMIVHAHTTKCSSSHPSLKGS